MASTRTPAPAPVVVSAKPASAAGAATLAQPQYLSVLNQATTVNSMATFANTAALLKLTTAQKAGGGAAAAPKIKIPPELEGYQLLVDRISNSARIASSVWNDATGSMLSFVSAADPSAFSTFGASATAVGIQIGQMFVPAVLALSGAMQVVAGTLSFMPGWASTMVGSTAALYLGFLAVARSLKAVGWEANLAAKAVSWLSAVWKSGPWGVASLIGGAVAGLITLAGGWSTVGQAADYATGGMVSSLLRVTGVAGAANSMIERTQRLLGMARPKENLKLPFESRVTSFEQYGESLQMKALETNDLDKANQLEVLRATLERLGEHKELLKQISDANRKTAEVLKQTFG